MYKRQVPDWFLDDCLSALTTGELFSLVEQMDGMVILPLYLYDHSGITMNTCGFSCPWDSGQVLSLIHISGKSLKPSQLSLSDGGSVSLLSLIHIYPSQAAPPAFQPYKDQRHKPGTMGFVSQINNRLWEGYYSLSLTESTWPGMYTPKRKRNVKKSWRS